MEGIKKTTTKVFFTLRIKSMGHLLRGVKWAFTYLKIQFLPRDSLNLPMRQFFCKILLSPPQKDIGNTHDKKKILDICYNLTFHSNLYQPSHDQTRTGLLLYNKLIWHDIADYWLFSRGIRYKLLLTYLKCKQNCLL